MSGPAVGTTRAGGDAEPEEGVRFCVHCGEPEGTGEHPRCSGPRAALDPPRFCAECARRMVVQVTPAGWTARCSRHGERSSAGAAHRSGNLDSPTQAPDTSAGH